MAQILYQVKQSKGKSPASGKWFAKVKCTDTLDVRQMAKHISEHGSIYTQDVVLGVLEKFRTCILEMLLESKKVKIDGLGTLYCTIENTRGGAAKKEDYNVGTHLRALHIRFMPEQQQEMNISSRQFLKKARFLNIESMGSLSQSPSQTSQSLTPNPSPTGEENQGGGGSQAPSTGGNGGGNGDQPDMD
jgi:predicted histone-like DNA-binding protein